MLGRVLPEALLIPCFPAALGLSSAITALLCRKQEGAPPPTDALFWALLLGIAKKGESSMVSAGPATGEGRPAPLPLASTLVVMSAARHITPYVDQSLATKFAGKGGASKAP